MTTPTVKDKLRVKELYYKILENTAEVLDYYEYEDILLKYHSKERIWKDLDAQGFRNWEQFYRARNPKPSVSLDDAMIVLLGAVLALGVAIILANLIKKTP